MLYHSDEGTRDESWGGILQDWYMLWDSYDLDIDEASIHWSAGRLLTPWSTEFLDDVSHHILSEWLGRDADFVVPDTEWVEYPTHIEPASSLVHRYRETQGDDYHWPVAIVSRTGQALLVESRDMDVDTTDLVFGAEAAIGMLETHSDRAVVSMVWDV